MSVVVSIEDTGASQKQVKVAVPAPAVEAETDRITAEYRKRARIPGFRKGKVPVSMVRQHFADDIERDVVERLVPRYWKQAEAESELDLLLAPQVGSVDFEFGSELTFTATVDLRPEFELGKLDDFELPEDPAPVSEEDVDNALEELRRSVAEWKEADRPAARGDRVVGQITALGREGDEAEEAPQPQPASFELGEGGVWEELTLAATGLAAGQGADFDREALEGGELEKRSFHLDVERVEERDLAPLDDAFAKRFGNFESLDDMRKGVEENMTREREHEHRRARQGAVVEQLCARHPFELPKRVVEQETREILEEYATTLARQGVDVEKADIDWQRMGEEFAPQAANRVRTRLVLDAAAEKLEMEVGEEELETALAMLAKGQGRSSGQLRQQLDRAGRLGELREQLRRDKTLRMLLGDEPEGGEAASEPAGEERDAESEASDGEDGGA